MSLGFIKVGSYYRGKYYGAVKDIKTIMSHLKYIGFRSRERDPDDKGFFNDKSDIADWREFYKGIANHKALKHSSTVKAHKMIFSLRKRDYDLYRESGRNYKDIVREVLKKYEERKGVKLAWIAAAHDKNDHPHCHVVIRAVDDSRGEKAKRIYFSKEDLAQMKKDFDLEVERHRALETEKDRNNEQDRSQELSMASLFNDISKSIERQQRINERERDIAIAKLEKEKKKGKGR